MRFRNLKIGTQLIIGLFAMLLFVVALGVVSYYQTGRIHSQIDIMYNHSLQVRNAIHEVNNDVYMIHWALETALAEDDFQGMVPYIRIISESEARMQRSFVILRDFYLGPQKDIIELEEVTLHCKANRDLVFHLLQTGDAMQAETINIHKGTVIGSYHLEEIIEKVDKVNDFSRTKATILMQQSQELRDRLTLQLAIIVIVLIVMSSVVTYKLLNSIRAPLANLTATTQSFIAGDRHARSSYRSENELGVLAESFNTLAESVQQNLEFNNKAGELSSLMLSEDESEKFFIKTLNKLAEITGSQMIAVYLLSDDDKQFEHFYSIGLEVEARKTFNVNELEGEFGKAASSGQIVHVQGLDQKTRFIFRAVSGDIVPAGILTVPIIASGDVVAMISLASLSGYDEQSLDFIRRMHNTLNARFTGILAYKRMTEFATRLEVQNQELENQKSELFSQTTELSSQNAELEIQKQQLNEANRLKTNFLSNMSHELRTPLNSVIALSGVLTRRLAGKIPEDEFGYISVIERNGKHLLSLINDILDLSRIEAGREDIEIAPFNVCEHVNEVMQVLLPQANEKNITLKAATGDCEMLISSDAHKFRHIIQNLIGNAVKFTIEGGVDVLVNKNEKEVEIQVRDTGIGIGSEHIAHIFDEFRQADGSTSRKFGGTGLGLSIAKKYAHLLGGNITVESSPGKGSVFTLNLPLEYQGYRETKTSQTSGLSRISGIDAPEVLSEKTETKTLLLVEDSEPAIIQIKDILEAEGYEMMVAENGRKAFEMLENQLPDGVILDLMMPEVDGFEVLTKLRSVESTRSLPVLILTAKHITKSDMEVLTHNHIFQLIQKGDISRTELLQYVKAMTSGPKDISPAKAAIKKQTIEGKPVILVVEDNHDNMLTVGALLEDEFEMLEATNGNEAVEMAGRHKPNLILMDIALPEMDGIDAFKAIRKNPALNNTPIVALTASAMTSDREIILAYGFDGYIAKPIDEKVFFETIKAVLYGK